MPEKNTSRGSINRPSSSNSAGTYYALVIGVATYTYQQDLEYPVQDAQQFKAVLTQHFSFPTEQVFLLENPTRTDIIEVLDELDEVLLPFDSLLIFYAGHGHWEKGRNRGYWLPTDAKRRGRAAWISNATLQDYLRGFKCLHTLIISDSCFSGAILMNRSDMDKATPDIKTLYSAKSRQALTSGVKEEVPDRSVFFKYLLYYLKHNRRNYLNATELFSKIRARIISDSPVHQNPQFGVIAETGDEGGDFIFIAKGKSQQALSLETPPFQKLLADAFIRERLLALREHLDKTIPAKDDTKHLLIGSWNIRKLGGFDYGGRLPEALGYIAEIISRFHVVAIQEIYGDLQILDDLKGYLGKHWDYTFSDTSVGFGYRLGYFFDKRKVSQSGPSNDLILPHKRTRDKKGRFVYEPVMQLLRPPFNCGFSIEGTRLLLSNVHLVFSGQQKKKRVLDLENIIEYWEQRLSQKNNWSKNVVLLGNFQTAKLSAVELHKVKDSAFDIPPILELPTNIQQNRYYTQMAFGNTGSSTFTVTNAGVINFFDFVFRLKDKQHYLPIYESFKAQATHLKTPQSKSIFYKQFWRTAQLSDNLPLWAELKYDSK